MRALRYLLEALQAGWEKTKMDLFLRGKRVLITGASKGIGAAAAEAFAEEGCELHLAARNEPALKALAQRLAREHGVNVTVHAADLRKSEDVQRLCGLMDQVDVLLNNAGDIPSGSLAQIDDETWRQGWELKVFGYISLTRAAYASMKARGGGVILNDIGVAAERHDFNYIAGTSGNAALMAFTRALGGRSLDDNIRVIGINPGPVETDRIVLPMKAYAKAQFGDEGRYRELMANLPLKRAATTREIADMMVFLASERSSYTSGSIITIDGGLSSRSGF